MNDGKFPLPNRSGTMMRKRRGGSFTWGDKGQGSAVSLLSGHLRETGRAWEWSGLPGSQELPSDCFDEMSVEGV
jgi:hypothetical protein